MILDKPALYRYLKEDIFPQIAPPPYEGVEITQLSSKTPVYIFTENSKKIRVVGKCFQHDAVTLEKAWEKAEKEYRNLEQIRKLFGTNNDGYRIVRPLGKKRELSAMLVVEKAPGRLLDYYIAKAIQEQQSGELFEKLGDLARLFVKFHRSDETNKQVSPDMSRWYLKTLLHTLAKRYLSPSDKDAIESYAGEWSHKLEVFDDREVIVHGDATPTNFLFHHREVICIDLERMKRADRCWDLGFMAAELKHHFMWRTGNGWNAEPFIGHFLWQYAVNYGNEQIFYSITRKLPLYMALGLLRIARNSWVDDAHRRNLLGEAKQCLRYKL
jgi:aminoglycoside phosphotransferase (APT) family kinase protein